MTVSFFIGRELSYIFCLGEQWKYDWLTDVVKSASCGRQRRATATVSHATVWGVLRQARWRPNDRMARESNVTNRLRFFSYPFLFTIKFISVIGRQINRNGLSPAWPRKHRNAMKKKKKNLSLFHQCRKKIFVSMIIVHYSRKHQFITTFMHHSHVLPCTIPLDTCIFVLHSTSCLDLPFNIPVSHTCFLMLHSTTMHHSTHQEHKLLCRASCRAIQLSRAPYHAILLPHHAQFNTSIQLSLIMQHSTKLASLSQKSFWPCSKLSIYSRLALPCIILHHSTNIMHQLIPHMQLFSP